ncbi:MFS transporter [Acuticoccus sp. M5D2P5]|uniref:MFS transporter n=1 Tax=Acuticoccus kalidii TaxID=2910977 RepID=UPI001F3E98CF|nr:MFS transporter [Acuticoccus kalidii]MCF3935384.1 MFS transporter [Acuticoccus kalidii]
MPHPTRADTNPTAMFALASSILLASLGVSLASVALPALSQAFSATISQVQWVVIGYLLSVTITILLVGRLGDQLGQRRVLVAGLLLFAAASVASAAAPDLGTLIAARAVQGIGGAILMALPVSLAREIVPLERTGSAMGLLGTMSAIGTALGPSLGGIVIAWFGWRAAFAALALVSLAALGLALRINLRAPSPLCGRIDFRWPSAIVLAVTLSGYALATAGNAVTLPFGSGVFALIAVGGLIVFIAIEARSATPLIPVRVLVERTVAFSLLMNMLVTTVIMTTLVVGPFYLAFGLGLDQAAVGLVLAVGPVVSALSGLPAGRATDRFRASRVLVAGLVAMTAGLVCLALLPQRFGVAGYIAALAIITPGYQLFLAANNTTLMLSARAGERGMLSGLLGLSRNLGFMTGASAMASLFAFALRGVDVTLVSADTLADAFAQTFLVAAGLTGFALVLGIAARPDRPRH